MYTLGRDRSVELLESRAAALARAAEADQATLSQAERDGVPPIFLSEHRYQLALRQAEHAWLVTFSQELQTGALGWPKRAEGPDQ